MSVGPDWLVQARRGTAAELHARWPEQSERGSRIIAVCDPQAPPAIVLGSSQTQPALDPVEVARTGVVFARRSSGGGAVHVAPAAQVWIDVWIPRSDPLWVDDVVLSSAWLGRAWWGAMTGLAVGEAVGHLAVHSGRLEKSRWGELVCFASTGPGEVCANGKKLVGVSQRRTREGALFHTYCPMDPTSRIVRLLSLEDRESRDLSRVLDGGATCLRELVVVGGHDVEDAQLLANVAQCVVSSIAGSSSWL
jgi:lipoate-protein ligase A